MKKIFFLASLFLASVSAYAGLAQSFVTTDNKSFTVNNAREITFSQGYVLLTFTDGSTSGQYLQDSNGSVALRIKGSGVLNSYVQVGNENRYIDPKYARWVVCQNNVTNVGWANTAPQIFSDNCQLFERIKASGN